MVSIIPKIEILSTRIIRILGCNPGPMTLQGTNTYLIGTGKKRALIDTGEDSNVEYISSLMNVLKEHGVQISDIIITHWHKDHIGGLCDVLSSTNRDARVFKMPCEAPKDDPLPDWVRLEPLKHLQEIAVEGATLRAHHTPGHSTDHMVLELQDGCDCGVFTGDCVLGEGTAVFEDLFDYMKSLKSLMTMTQGNLYPGHGPVIADGKEKVEYYINHRNKREMQILNTLDSFKGKKATPSELVKVVYKDTPIQLHGAAEGNLRHHLSKLVKEGKVTNEEHNYTVVETESKL